MTARDPKRRALEAKPDMERQAKPVVLFQGTVAGEGGGLCNKIRHHHRVLGG